MKTTIDDIQAALAALEPKVQDPSDRERFQYWLHTFLSMKAMGKVDCLWAAFDLARNMT